MRTCAYRSKPIGKTLLAANLISPAQINVALGDQARQKAALLPNKRIGEILSLRGWIEQETVDFLVEKWPKLLKASKKEKIGYYLQEAGLLSPSQIAWIIRYQKSQLRKQKFGEIAKKRGWIKCKTLQYFLNNLTQNFEDIPLESQCKSSINQHHDSSKSVKEILRKYVMGSMDLQKSLLDGANFNNIVLEYANLEYSLIRNSSLEECVLNFANLTKTNLLKSNLAKASLVQTKLESAILQKSNLSQALLRRADLRGADLREADLRGADLRDAHLEYAQLQGADLRGCNLKGAFFTKACFDQATLFDTQINPVKLGMKPIEKRAFNPSKSSVKAQRKSLLSSRKTIILH